MRGALNSDLVFPFRKLSQVVVIEFGDEQATFEALSPAGYIIDGDVVLVKVHGRVYLHLVKGIEAERVLIGNNRGGTNGWTPRSSIFGIAPDV